MLRRDADASSAVPAPSPATVATAGQGGLERCTECGTAAKAVEVSRTGLLDVYLGDTTVPIMSV